MGFRQGGSALVVNGGGLVDMKMMKTLKGRLFKSVAETPDGMEALSRLRFAPETDGTTRTAFTETPGAIFISLKTCDVDPYELCRIVKKGIPEALVIMVGDRNSPGDLNLGFDGSAADDFLLWPFDAAELEARLELLAKRGARGASGAVADGSLPNVDDFIDGMLVLEVLAVNRQCAVYKILNRKLGQVFALKLLTAKEGSRAAKRFEREAEIMSRMDHPNLIKFHKKGMHKGSPYILMDYIDGADLEDYLLVRGVPPLDAFFKVAMEIARGLEALHAQGVVHKDIKLANILLPCSGGHAVLSDLGTASEKAPGKASPSDGALSFIEGTPIYMAPEVFAGEEPGVLSDIYSFGAALYHFLTGSPPFAGKAPSEAAGEKAEFIPNSARLLRPETPEELDIFIVERCMAKNPSARPSSMGEVLESLGRIDEGRQVAGVSGKSGLATLLVDDERAVLDTLKTLLRREPYELLCANGSSEALEIMSRRKVHLVVSDFRMPGMNGIELAKVIRERWPDTVVMMFSGQADTETVVSAINSGHVYKFLVKGWFREDLRQNIRLALEQYALRERNRELDRLLAERNRELSEANAGLERKVNERMDELLSARGRVERQCKGLVEALFKIMELHSEDMPSHGRRVGLFAKSLAELSGAAAELSLEVETAGYLHDIGKISLHSESGGRLSKDEESLLMRRHPSIGAKILESIPEFLSVAEMIRQHHESYDGHGYPEGLPGGEICFGARVLAVADAFDRLVRPEGSSMVRRLQVVEESLGKLSGKRLDPALTRIFLESLASKLHASFEEV